MAVQDQSPRCCLHFIEQDRSIYSGSTNSWHRPSTEATTDVDLDNLADRAEQLFKVCVLDIRPELLKRISGTFENQIT